MPDHVEILQASSLEDYDWPQTDPHTVPQRTRAMVEKDIDLVRACLKSAEINLDAFLKETRHKGLTKQETVLALLSHQKFQMNPVSSVRQEPKWLSCVTDAMQHGNVGDHLKT